MRLDPQWLFFADNDLRTAEILMREEVWNQVCFHSQQCVEKFLKASLSPESRPRTHKIADLLSRTPLPLEEGLKRELRRLDRFYIPSRYPDALPGLAEEGMPNREDAASSLRAAQSLSQVIRGLL